MSDVSQIPLSVSIRDLPETTVACSYREIVVLAGDFSELIARKFQAVKHLAARLGHAPSSCEVIGVSHVMNGQLIGYECCVQVPASVQTSDHLQIRQLAGGRHAVLTLAKDPSAIGGSIARFFAEYVPQHHLNVDDSRPNFEMCHTKIMEFCVPVK